MEYRPCTILCATILAAANPRASAQEMPDPPQAEDEVELTLDDVVGSIASNSEDLTIKLWDAHLFDRADQPPGADWRWQEVGQASPRIRWRTVWGEDHRGESERRCRGVDNARHHTGLWRNWQTQWT